MQQLISINDWRNSLLDTELNTSTKLVGIALAKYFRQDKLCFPSISTLMAECSIKSKHTVIKAIDELKKAGLIKVKKGELKYVSSLQNFYEFVGVDNSASNGASNGATNGAINAPEIREKGNIGNIGNNIIHAKSKKLVSPDWKPRDTTIAKLTEKGLDADKVVDKFINSCIAKNHKYIDFDRAILTWDWSRDASLKLEQEEKCWF